MKIYLSLFLTCIILLFNSYIFYVIKHYDTVDSKTLKSLSVVLIPICIILNYLIHQILSEYYPIDNWKHLSVMFLAVLILVMQIWTLDAIYKNDAKKLNIFNSLSFIFTILTISVVIIHIKTDAEKIPLGEVLSKKYDDLLLPEELYINTGMPSEYNSDDDDLIDLKKTINLDVSEY
jgi:hypothetical protein